MAERMWEMMREIKGLVAMVLVQIGYDIIFKLVIQEDQEGVNRRVVVT